MILARKAETGGIEPRPYGRSIQACVYPLLGGQSRPPLRTAYRKPVRRTRRAAVSKKTGHPSGWSVWQGQKGSNSRHAVLETAALPTELYPYVVGLRGLEPGTGRL